jgi:membrane protease YdiL (CAAX protease family)
VPVAAISKEISLPPDQALPIYAVALCLLYAGILVYRKMLRSVRTRGGYVRSDLFGLPDMIFVFAFVVLTLLAFTMQWIFPTAAAGGAGIQILTSVLFLAVPVILALMIVRGISVPTVFGLNRVNPLRALGTAAALVVLLLPVIVLVNAAAYEFLGGHAEQQDIVKKFHEAAKAGKQDVVWRVAVMATFVAPILEEILFRGYFYPVLKRIAGPLPAAIGTSVIFGAIHDNALGFPGLTALALALTFAYEWSGSILVPMCMHACFNSATLAYMWWQSAHGIAP